MAHTGGLAFERVGSGPPLVLLHGVGHRRQAWYPVLPLLTPHREVVLVDLPGHGESGPLPIDPDRDVVDVVRTAIRDFMVEQGLERPHVAGNSLGGLLALAEGSRGAASSVTALSPAGFWRSDAAWTYTRLLFGAVLASSPRMRGRAPRLVTSPAGRAAMFSWLVAHPGRLDPDLALGDYYALLAAAPAVRTLVASAGPFTEAISPSVPVTIAWARHDRVLPYRQRKVAAVTIPHARAITLRGCGHVPMSDDPAQVARVLLEGSA